MKQSCRELFLPTSQRTTYQSRARKIELTVGKIFCVITTALSATILAFLQTAMIKN
jgi:hypothetical protein